MFSKLYNEAVIEFDMHTESPLKTSLIRLLLNIHSKTVSLFRRFPEVL